MAAPPALRIARHGPRSYQVSNMPRKIFPLVTLCIAFFSPFAGGTTLQVSEDSYAGESAKMNRNTGKSPTLEVSPGRPAYIRFDAGDFARQIPAADVTAARLTFYIANRRTAGELNVHRVTSEWAENPAGNRNPPSYAKIPLATLRAPSLREGQFVVIDVTDLAKRWLATPEKDFGLAIVGDDKSAYLIPSKEGAENGLPAFLEIDHHPLVNDSRISAGLDVAKLGNGSVNNTQFAFLNGVNSPVQGQFDVLGGDLENLRKLAEAQGTELDAANADIATHDDRLANLDSTVNGLGIDLTNLADSSAGKVSKSGDTMTGPLLLPADGLKVGTNQLTVTAGKVGIGTDMPSAALEVRGDVKLGAAGDLQAAAGEESLRIIRGVLENQNGSLQLLSGSGFTFATLPEEPHALEITFSRPFSSVPSVSVEEEVPSDASSALGNFVRATNATRIEIKSLANPTFSGIRIHFIAIGPR